MGKIIPVSNPGLILSSIDVISEIIFPSWNVLKWNRSADIETAELHLRLLWQRSNCNFDIQSTNEPLEQFSYNAWIEAFEELFKSNYWQSMDLVSNTVLHLNSSFRNCFIYIIFILFINIILDTNYHALIC